MFEPLKKDERAELKFIFKWKTFCAFFVSLKEQTSYVKNCYRLPYEDNFIEKVYGKIRTQTLEAEPDIDMEATYLGRLMHVHAQSCCAHL